MSNEQTIIQVNSKGAWLDYCRCTIEQAQYFLNAEGERFRVLNYDHQPYLNSDGTEMSRHGFITSMRTPQLVDHTECVGLIVGDRWWHCPKHNLYEWDI